MKSEVQITTHKDGTSTIIVDGKDLSLRVRSFSLNQKVYARPTLELEYACYEQTTIEGQVDVVHVCPKKAR